MEQCRVFQKALKERLAGRSRDRSRWVFVAYDQLTDRVGPLSRCSPEETAVVLVETTHKGKRRPYHKQKLAWILANQRHFALELARKGYFVEYLLGDRDYGELLEPLASERGPLVMMEAAERELRESLKPLIDEGLVEVVAHEGWLTTTEQFRRSQRGEPPWRMDAFYRLLRRETGILMDDDGPRGGKFSFDEENREPWSGEPPAPEPPTFEVDEITAEVGELIRREFADHPGHLDLTRVAATVEDAQEWWRWAKERCLTHFGPYEDAMSSKSRTIFHTLVSPLINLHRLLPREVVGDVEELEIPLASKEGFIRQVLGWREFIAHVHRETDGFRDLPEGYEENYLGADFDLVPAYWGDDPSGLRCLDEAVASVVEEGYSHHITRLMVLSNIATLLDLSPRQVTDWFWVMYVDAYDWVVEPNVLGMGMFALGDLFTTKPYVSGSNYIAKMSDYCGDCAFDPKKNCPLRSLYWAFLARHEERLDDLGRMGLMLGMMRKRSEERRARDAEIFEEVRRRLAAGKRLDLNELG